MIKALTPEQEKQLRAARAAAFRHATATAPADRPRAVAAAQKLARLGGLTRLQVVWVSDPAAGKAAYEAAWAQWLVSFRGALRGRLRAALARSLQHSLWNRPQASLERGLRTGGLAADCGNALWDRLRVKLRNKLEKGFEDGLRDSLKNSLWDSLWDSRWDTGWLAFYQFCGTLVRPRKKDQENLRPYQELLASCFALWLVPGTIILCERPATATIRRGKVTNLTWRTPA
jgi:hypothetical protein